MKATGIVRRIDDLGRVVIPKEIRRTLRIVKATAGNLHRPGRGNYIKKILPRSGSLEALQKNTRKHWPPLPVRASASRTGIRSSLSQAA